MVIALKTDPFELAKTDISTLLVGESQSIKAGSGKIIDVPRTADGIEIYSDGDYTDLERLNF